MTSALKKSDVTENNSISMQEDYGFRGRTNSHSTRSPEETAKLVKYIDDNIIGKGSTFCGPFGRRKVVLCDYASSGRSVRFIEEYVSREVLAAHAADGGVATHTAAQTQHFRTEARSLVGGGTWRVLVRATPARVLAAPGAPPPIVFVGRLTARAREQWLTSGAEIVSIPETKEGFIDLNHLESRLREHAHSPRLKAGVFATACALSGVRADETATALLLQQHGALACWECELAAPGGVAVAGVPAPRADALFVDCGRLVGGVQAPPVALVREGLAADCGELEEAWSAPEAVRAALALQLRDAVGSQHIAARNEAITRQVLAHIKNIPELVLLGNDSPSVRKLPIFSMLVRHPRGAYLHHGFVAAVLSDVFGVQAGGAPDADPAYAADMLGIDQQLLREYEKVLTNSSGQTDAAGNGTTNQSAEGVSYFEHIRPGFVRISLPYFISDSELAFVLEGLKMVATEAWKILPQYIVDCQTGQWRHYTNTSIKDKKSIFNIRYTEGKMSCHDRRISGPGIFPQNYTECLLTARNLFNRARKLAIKCSHEEQQLRFNPRTDYLRWFMLPSEARNLLCGSSAGVKHTVPFHPSGYTGARKSLLAFDRSPKTGSPVFGATSRHYSMSAIDDCQFACLKQRQKMMVRHGSVLEDEPHDQNDVDLKIETNQPVQFALGESVSPLYMRPQMSTLQTPSSRSRCYSLGSESPPPAFSPQTIINLGLTVNQKNAESKSTYCNCGSQTDLQSLDDPMLSPTATYLYGKQNSTSNSDCSQVGRSSPTVSLTSQNSEDLQAYVKEMTKEIAIEIKSEIREVISRVEDVLDNSDSIELNNLSITSNSSQMNRDSVSIVDVAEYLMGISKEMASEVTSEIREMVSQVDEMISPDYHSYSSGNSRKNSPPQSTRRRLGSATELGLHLGDLGSQYSDKKGMRKCPTSPILSEQANAVNDLTSMSSDVCCKKFGSPTKYQHSLSSQNSPKSVQTTPPYDVSFNSSETSSPDTIIQVMTNVEAGTTLPKSVSSHKLSDDDSFCMNTEYRPYCTDKSWSQSVSSQDSGINMSFPETDTYQELVKWRTSSDPTGQRRQRAQTKLRSSSGQILEKSEVPDIIEGVPICSGDYQRHCGIYKCELSCEDTDSRKSSRSSYSDVSSKRSSRSSITSSVDSSDIAPSSSGYSTDSQPTVSENCTGSYDLDNISRDCPDEQMEEKEEQPHSESSTSNTDCSGNDPMADDDGKWHCPPKSVWKSTIEAIQEFGMIKHQDKILVCLSGGCHSMALLHTLRQYQFYARAKGLNFTIGAIFVHDPTSNIDPLHLMAYCRNLGVKFIYEDNLDTRLDTEKRAPDAAELCRWACHGVRRAVYAAAAARGYAACALGHTLQHAARAFLAAVCQAGELRTVKAHYYVREHNLRVIRPFVYVRENSLHHFIETSQLPDFGNDEQTMKECGDDKDRSSTGEASSEAMARPTSVKFDRSMSAPERGLSPKKDSTRSRRGSQPLAPVDELLSYHEKLYPCLFSSLKMALHPLISAKNIDKELKEHRHRKKSVIQMKNGIPVYDSDEGTDEEPLP